MQNYVNRLLNKAVVSKFERPFGSTRYIYSNISFCCCMMSVHYFDSLLACCVDHLRVQIVWKQRVLFASYLTWMRMNKTPSRPIVRSFEMFWVHTFSSLSFNPIVLFSIGNFSGGYSKDLNKSRTEIGNNNNHEEILNPN